MRENEDRVQWQLVSIYLSASTGAEGFSSHTYNVVWLHAWRFDSNCEELNIYSTTESQKQTQSSNSSAVQPPPPINQPTWILNAINLTFCKFIKAPSRNFDFALIVALRVEKSGTAYSRKDLVHSEHLFWKRVKETPHLFPPNTGIIWRKISSCFQP